MAVPSIDLLPTPALSTDPEDVFNSKTDATLLAQQKMVPQVNLSLTWIGQQVTAVDGYRQAAAQSATDAANSATTSQQQASAAFVARQAAEAARDSAQAAAAAAGSGAGLPSLPGNIGRFLGVNADGTAVGWYDVGQKIGDVLMTARVPDASYLNMNGAIYLQSAYPALFVVLGLIGGDVGTSWSSVASGYTSVLKVARGSNGTLIAITTLSNMVARSTDNGATWASINAGVSTYAADIDTDGNGKWIIALSTAVNGSAIRISTDDGLTWSAGATNVPTSLIICRYVANNVWLIGGGNALYRSADNGAIWSGAITNPRVNTGSVLATDRNGVVVLYNTSSTPYRSIDGFATAAIAVAAFSTAPTAMTTDGSGTWTAVGASGYMARSLDNGMTFSAITSGTTVALSSISTDGKGVWLVGGASGLLRRSKDNLNTWDTVSGLAGTVQALVQTPTLAIAGSNNGAIYRSAPAYSYDTTTQFKVPQGSSPTGINSYIKAKVTA